MYTKNKQTLLMPKTNHNNKKRMEIATAKRQRLRRKLVHVSG